MGCARGWRLLEQGGASRQLQGTRSSNRLSGYDLHSLLASATLWSCKGFLHAVLWGLCVVCHLAFPRVAMQAFLSRRAAQQSNNHPLCAQRSKVAYMVMVLMCLISAVRLALMVVLVLVMDRLNALHQGPVACAGHARV
jgi:hypothetical protein